MCFELDSVPPIAPIEGGAVDHSDLELESEDGNRFAAFAALAEEPSDVGVVILPDVRGLYRFYEELALRFAERGIAAVAIDFYGRTAGVGKRGDDFEYPEHRAQTTPEGVQADVRAGVDWLRDQGIGAIFTVGFCFGGRHSWLAAAGGHGLHGAVGFYGMPGGDSPSPIDKRGGDGGPGPRSPGRRRPEHHGRAQRGVRRRADHSRGRARGRRCTRRPHSFFDRKQAEFADASENAWNRTLAFIERYR